MAGPVRPADVLGVPMLPPSGVARAGNRLRAGLARLGRGSAPPPGRVMEAVLGSLDLAVLAAMCRLDLPDRLGEPTPCADLAADLGVDPHRLERLLRYAATRGVVTIDRRGRIAPTRLLAFLRRDHPGGWRAWVEFAAGPEVAGSLAALDAGLQPHGDAFETANGAPFFEWMSAHPDRHAVFDAAMAAGARMHGLLLADAIDWSASRRVCDVGGGDGSLLRVLLGRHPHLQGVLLELPDVVARAPAHPAIEPVPGDAFRAVPPGCDTYLFVNVLHDWNDDAAVALLQCAAEAMSAAPPDGPATRVVIVDSEAHDRPRDDLAIRADVLMLALTPGGRERTAAEFATLAQRAGLRLRRTRRLLTGDAVHVLGAAGD
jgi:hypothetical protein